MILEITKSNHWYANKVGKLFQVVRVEKGGFVVIPEIGVDCITAYVDFSDCTIPLKQVEQRLGYIKDEKKLLKKFLQI